MWALLMREWGEALWTAPDVLEDEMREAQERAAYLLPDLTRFGAKPTATA